MIVAAMSEEVKGAIVGGLLGAVVVVVAVLGEAWLARVWERRRTVEAAAIELVRLVPEIVNPISKGWDHDANPVDTSITSEWNRQKNHVENVWFTIIQNARWPMRNRKKVLAATYATMARWIAHETLWLTVRSPMTTAEAFDLLAEGPTSVLTRAKDLLSEAVDYEVKARQVRGLRSRTILPRPEPTKKRKK